MMHSKLLIKTIVKQKNPLYNVVIKGGINNMQNTYGKKPEVKPVAPAAKPVTPVAKPVETPKKPVKK